MTAQVAVTMRRLDHKSVYYEAYVVLQTGESTASIATIAQGGIGTVKATVYISSIYVHFSFRENGW